MTKLEGQNLKLRFDEFRLANAVQARLKDEGCEKTGEVEVKIDFLEVKSDDWIANDYHLLLKKRQPTTVTNMSAEIPRAKVTVLKGTPMNKTTYSLSGSVFTIGRGEEVRRDIDNKITRRNTLAFKDDDESLKLGVSRRHAEIFYDSRTACYRLRDNKSECGTTIIRDNKTNDVPKGDDRGVKLESGDEIELGQTRIKFEIKS